MNEPLANYIRPTTLDEVVGQSHLVGVNGLIRKMLQANYIPNMILYGPSGTGKTTIARIIANSCSKRLYCLNATTCSLSDIKNIKDNLNSLESSNGVLLYLDEIQYFSKKQQQSLLEFIEDGQITLIASTTENPYFYIYNAILSRSTIFEFKPIPSRDLKTNLIRAIEKYQEIKKVKIDFEDGIVDYIVSVAGGDARKSINILEVLISVSDLYNGAYHLSLESAKMLALSPVHYDKDGDEHYDMLSAFQKSIRGSDPDAAIFYLAKLLACKDIISPCRRLLVIASEDIGLAYPQAASIVKSLVDSALQLGLPEARIPLSEATLLLALAPKSNSAINAIDKALEAINNGLGKDIPAHIKDAHYQGANALGHGINYLYPHDFPNHYVLQQYLPDDIKDIKFYDYQNNKFENGFKSYWENVKKNK